MNYIERWAKRPSNPFTAVFYPSVSVMAFEVQIYGRRSTAVPVKRTVRSPTCACVLHFLVLTLPTFSHLATDIGYRGKRLGDDDEL